MAEEKKTKKEKKPTAEGKKDDKAKKTAAEKKGDEPKTSRTHVIPLRDAFRGLRNRRAKRASKIISDYVKKHAKAVPTMDPSVSAFIHSRGKTNIPRRVKVTVSKEGDKAVVKLAE